MGHRSLFPFTGGVIVSPPTRLIHAGEPGMRIRPGSLMIRLLAVFFGLMTAYGTYLNVSRQPIGEGPAAEESRPPVAAVETPGVPVQAPPSPVE